MSFRLEIFSVFLSILISGCAAQTAVPAGPPNEVTTTVTSTWNKAAIPFKAAGVIAVGDVFWVCGDNEMIASSSDGGKSWDVRHQEASGATLLNISFVTENVGHAAGTKGRLLSTVDGGKTWEAHTAYDDIWAFSFSGAISGIAVIGGDRDDSSTMDGDIRLTHDGGNHWEDIPALGAKELSPFTLTLAVAALNASNYVMLRRQPEVEDAFFVTHDAGKSWHVVHQRDDVTNRELAQSVFVHGGEYWAFGMELVHRDTRGGYGVPLTLHSKDGETWIHGTSGPKEFGGCNQQGCYMWDGTVESLYGEHPQYWALPQDGTMSRTWALTQDHACTIGDFLQCGSAIITDQPQPRPTRPSGPLPIQAETIKTPEPAFRPGLPEGCVQCRLDSIPWNIQQKSVLWIVATLHVGPAGEIKDVALNQKLEELGPLITHQLLQWKFRPSSDATEATRSVRLVVRCGFDDSECQIIPTVTAQ